MEGGAYPTTDPFLQQLANKLYSIPSGVGFTLVLSDYVVTGTLISPAEFDELIDRSLLQPPFRFMKKVERGESGDNKRQRIYDEDGFIHLKDVTIFISENTTCKVSHFRVSLTSVKGWALGTVV